MSKSKREKYRDGLARSNNWKKRNRPKMNDAKATWRLQTKRRAFAILGDKCSNPACQWLNGDGTRGCTDHRCLQIDHVKSDGRLERVSGKSYNSLSIYRKIVRGVEIERYQLLCANCNWLKRYEQERSSCANKTC